MVTWIGIGVGVLGLLFAANSYYHLWRWARDCQTARIIIGYKNKAVFQAPLVEWLLWCRKARKDGYSSGRTVFSRQGVSVSVAQPIAHRTQAKQEVKNALRRGKGKVLGLVHRNRDGSDQEDSQGPRSQQQPSRQISGATSNRRSKS